MQGADLDEDICCGPIRLVTCREHSSQRCEGSLGVAVAGVVKALLARRAGCQHKPHSARAL